MRSSGSLDGSTNVGRLDGCTLGKCGRRAGRIPITVVSHTRVRSRGVADRSNMEAVALHFNPFTWSNVVAGQQSVDLVGALCRRAEVFGMAALGRSLPVRV